jgi:serine/threonine-protein kinase
MVAPFRSGTIVLGKYRIDSVHGRDGMYVVLRVSHAQLGSDLVLRMLLPEAATSLSVHARFVRAAQAAARLRGEHVARLIDVGVSSDGVPYLVTEPVRGVDLAAELARRGALIPEEAVDCVLQACAAVAEAHAHGIAHGNLATTSVLLTARPDGTPLIKLLGFGVPHGASDELDPRVDLRALGAVLHECLTGRPAVPAGARGAAASEPPAMDPRIPTGLQAAVLRCLGVGGAGFGSVAELVAELAPFAHDRRAAGFLVERTNQLAHGAGLEPHAPDAYLAASPPAAASAPWPAPPPSVRARRRYATIAVVALGASIGGISTAALVRHGRARGSSAPPATARLTTTASTASLPIAPTAAEPPPAAAPTPSAAAEPPPPAANPTVPAAATPTTPAAPAAAAPIPAAVPPSAAARPPTTDPAPPPAAVPPPTAPAPTADPARGDAERTQKLAACADLQSQKRWQALEACAADLAKLGATGSAEQLRATARQEAQNEQLNDQARQALRDGNLKQSQAALQQIDAGSVYLAPLRDAFLTAERQRTDDVRRKAQGLADGHDCAGVKRLVTQLRTTATEPVVAAARAVACDDDDAPDERPAARPAATPAAPPRPRKESCDTLDPTDLMTRAATEYDAGAAQAALSLARIALGCKQTDRMYWLAVMYACAAHDAAAARQYFAKVPANLQAGIERKCQQDNLDVRTR